MADNTTWRSMDPTERDALVQRQDNDVRIAWKLLDSIIADGDRFDDYTPRVQRALAHLLSAYLIGLMRGQRT